MHQANGQARWELCLRLVVGRIMNALKGLYNVAQGQQQRHPGKRKSPVPFFFTLKGLDKSLCRDVLCNGHESWSLLHPE